MEYVRVKKPVIRHDCSQILMLWPNCYFLSLSLPLDSPILSSKLPQASGFKLLGRRSRGVGVGRNTGMSDVDTLAQSQAQVRRAQGQDQVQDIIMMKMITHSQGRYTWAFKLAQVQEQLN